MVRLTRTPIAAGIAAALLAALTACGGGTSTSSGGSSHAKTLTYWASNQGSSIQDDYHKLGPQLQKFQQQTGIKVKLEVVGWPDLLNRILAATTSGRGPDLVNIGNTWSASLQSTGAFVPFTATTFNRIGGENRFLRSAIGSKAVREGGHRRPAHHLGRADRRRQEAHPRRQVRPRHRGREHS